MNLTFAVCRIRESYLCTSPGDWLKLMIPLFLFRWVFGLYDGRMDSLITGLQSAEGIKQVSYWGDINDPLRFNSKKEKKANNNKNKK